MPSMFPKMRLSGSQIASAFADELSPEAAARISAKLIECLADTRPGEEDMGARVMLMGALSAVSPDTVFAQLDHEAKAERGGMH